MQKFYRCPIISIYAALCLWNLQCWLSVASILGDMTWGPLWHHKWLILELVLLSSHWKVEPNRIGLTSSLIGGERINFEQLNYGIWNLEPLKINIWPFWHVFFLSVGGVKLQLQGGNVGSTLNIWDLIVKMWRKTQRTQSTDLICRCRCCCHRRYLVEM